MSEKILVIDDDERVREMLTSILIEEGYQCFSVSNPQDSITLMESETIDLALIDIMMPSSSGVKILLDLKSMSPKTKAIMVTGFHDIETAKFCLNSGADDYIVKPFKISEVVKRVGEVLGKSR